MGDGRKATAEEQEEKELADRLAKFKEKFSKDQNIFRLFEIVDNIKHRLRRGEFENVPMTKAQHFAMDDLKEYAGRLP